MNRRISFKEAVGLGDREEVAIAIEGGSIEKRGIKMKKRPL